MNIIIHQNHNNGNDTAIRKMHSNESMDDLWEIIGIDEPQTWTKTDGNTYFKFENVNVYFTAVRGSKNMGMDVSTDDTNLIFSVDSDIPAIRNTRRRRVIDLYGLIKQIMSDTRMEWDKKYDTIFDDKVSGEMRDMIGSFEWYDPDTTYQEDVTAYVRALGNRLIEMGFIKYK